MNILQSVPMSMAPKKKPVPQMSTQNMSVAPPVAPQMTPAPPKPMMTPAPNMSIAQPAMSPAPNMSVAPPNMSPAPVMTPKPAPVPTLSTPAVPQMSSQNMSVAPPAAPAPNSSTPNGPAYNGAFGAKPAVPQMTSSGGAINPATGGVTPPSGDVPPVPAPAPAVPTPPPVPTGATGPGTPTTPATLTPEEQAYKDSLNLTPEELAAQGQLDALDESYKTAYLDINGQPIPLQFITGQQKAVESRKLALAEPLEKKMARLEAKRISAQNASKFSLERADKKLEAEEEKKKPFSISEGEEYGRINENGEYESIRKNPKTFAPENASDFKFQKVGNKLYRVNDDGTLTEVTPENPGDEQLTTSALTALTDLEKMPGLSSAVGAKGLSSFFGLKSEPIQGTAAADFNTKLEQFKSNMTLSMIPHLKGTGAISDAEERMLASSATSLSTKMSEVEFKAEMARMKVILENASVKEQSGQTSEYPPMELDGIMYEADENGEYSPKSKGGADAANLRTLSIGGNSVKVDQSIAGRLASAAADFKRATGKDLQINQHFRTSEQQAELYRTLKPKGARVAPPGQSFHEKGLAIDVTNWKDAMPYLRKYGLRNDLADDRGHFSFGETHA